MKPIHAVVARLPGRWARDVRIAIGADGCIASIDEGVNAQGADRVACLLPGMTNLHSHAFQRALAGLTEVASAGDDDFWSWREWMYRFMARIEPDDVEAIAAQLYVENLRHGYTSIVEFHYLHNDPHGAAYTNPAEMSERIVAAARASGIALTLAPVLYTYGGFGRRPLTVQQRRFATDVDTVLKLVERLKQHGDVRLGAAPHSLRAAEPEQIRALVDALPSDAPLHIHVAEQTREVDDCIAATGKRPLRLLLDEVGLDARWCAVHATHLADDELRDLAASGAVAGLCPSTEADLGDGVFRFVEFTAAGGRFGIGGDSNVCRSPFEELRLLEYAQRLTHRRRNLALHAPGIAIADALWDAAAHGGAQAAARNAGAIEVGRSADLIALAIRGAGADEYDPQRWLSLAVFGGAHAAIDGTWVGGRSISGIDAASAQSIADRYARTIRRLAS
jgi:formimidoylglutamate deiminase